MTVRVYYSTDASAPSLTGQSGALIGILDACLVNGYGSKAAAGWTKPFSGTNLAAYLQGSGGNGHYLSVDDTGTTTARCVGYEAMTDVSTGTNAFPLAAQLSGGGYFYKSSTADATARAWCLIATEKAFYLYIGYAEASLVAALTSPRHVYFFGSITSFKTGDAYGTMLIANSASASNGSAFGASAYNSYTIAQNGHFMARSYTQSGQSVTCGKYSSAVIPSHLGYSTSTLTYPDPVSGGMLLSPVYVYEAVALARRGLLPGCWGPVHSLPGQCGDTFTGVGEMAGKEFILLNASVSSTTCRVAIEISDTW